VRRIVLFTLLAAVGCGPSGPPMGKLAGRVTSGGQPMAGLEVSAMLTREGVGASALLDADGRFAIDEPLPLGEYVITVNPPPMSPPTPGQAPPPPPTKTPIPRKYRLEKTSNLRAPLKPGANWFDFDLTP
jgi:hypothetical protein